jgi:AAA+ ATPase superfamily predicted ATPase
MLFLDRKKELSRLQRLAAGRDGGLAVVYGRRRIGKTRLLLEWTRGSQGVYFVADQSSAEIQRSFFAEAVAERLPGFADVVYRDWRSLLDRLAADAASHHFRGPIVVDELPYLVSAAPELPSVLQRFVDHEARQAKLVVALAGSSQRMMQGLALDPHAPLYGRASVLFDVGPLEPSYLRKAFPKLSPLGLVDTYAAWGGVPRYWELAAERGESVAASIDALVLDPGGVLHDEPVRLLLEESPAAMEVRPLLDAIGAGAHRVSEIAGRIGRPATSLSRPLERLQELGLVERQIPFGQSERDTKRALYKLVDPFFRLWFRVVGPHRGMLQRATREARRELLARHWDGLRGAAWEQLCRERLPFLPKGVAHGGPWKVGSRWWLGAEPEWDIVAESVDGRAVLLGEARAQARPLAARELAREAGAIAAKAPPRLGGRKHVQVRVLFVPEVQRGAGRVVGGVRVVTAEDLVARR